MKNARSSTARVRSTRWSPAATALATACLLGAMTSAGCKRETPLPPAEQRPATVEKVKEQPAAYYGKEVTLIGEVDAVRSARAFELENLDLFDEQVLVVSRDDILLGGRLPADDQKIRVTGTVRPMVIAEIEREIGWDLTPEIEAEFSTKPVVVARSVALVDRPEVVWNAPPAAGDTAGATAGSPIVDLTAIVGAPAPATLVGRRVELTGATVQEVISDRVFWIGDAKRQLLVALDETPTPDAAVEGMVNVQKGQTVRLEGTVQPLPSKEVMKNAWKVKQPAKVAGRQTIFVQARRVIPAQPNR